MDVRTLLAATLIAWPLSTFAGAGQQPAPDDDRPRVTGTISYRERLALLPGAVITVQLADVSRADAPAIVLATQAIETGTVPGPPFAFSIPYTATDIDPAHVYAVMARIEVGGRLRFISDTRYAVITRGAPTRVDVVVRGVSRPR